MTIKDADGNAVQAGDTIHFAYGIPPVRVDAQIVEYEGDLWVLTPGHKPEKTKLSTLKSYVVVFYKLTKG